MNKFLKELEARKVRFNELESTFKQFRDAFPSYAFQAGFFESQLMMLAADTPDATADLIRTMNRVVANKQQLVSEFAESA